MKRASDPEEWWRAGDPVTENHKIVLARRPGGKAIEDDDFSLEVAPVEQPGPGEFLVRVCWLGFEPAQRGWLDDVPSYIPPVQIGEVMRSMGVGEVVASRRDEFPVGALVSGSFGWQEYALSAGTGLLGPVQVVPGDVAPTAPLGVLGLTGLTAYFGMLEIGHPTLGDTVLVSGAAGATGSVAGQLARIAGAEVIGIAGGAEKCAWLKDVAGFDAAIDYKSEDATARIAELAPDGIDVMFDNVGGEILEAGLANMAEGARFVLCGAISTRYSLSEEPPPGVRNLAALIVRRGRMEGFIALDFADRFEEATAKLRQWVQDGRLRHAEDIQQADLAAAPAVLRRLYTGQNLGKQLLQLAEPS
jgi:NADPH-dependent curcumin reductase CurA